MSETTHPVGEDHGEEGNLPQQQQRHGRPSVQKITTAQLQTMFFHPKPPPTSAEDEDASNGMFLSEPSVSEGGESRVRAPHSGYTFQNTLMGRRRRERNDALSSSEEEDEKLPQNRLTETNEQLYNHTNTRPRPQRRVSATSQSPGENTSLSSWEPGSPAPQRRVWLQFVMPESKAAKRARQQQRALHRPPQQQNATTLTDTNSETTRFGQWAQPDAIEGNSSFVERQSPVMTFSESEAGGDAVNGSQHSDRPLDWEAQNSADDERTAPSARRTGEHERRRHRTKSTSMPVLDWEGPRIPKMPNRHSKYNSNSLGESLNSIHEEAVAALQPSGVRGTGLSEPPRRRNRSKTTSMPVLDWNEPRIPISIRHPAYDSQSKAPRRTEEVSRVSDVGDNPWVNHIQQISQIRTLGRSGSLRELGTKSTIDFSGGVQKLERQQSDLSNYDDGSGSMSDVDETGNIAVEQRLSERSGVRGSSVRRTTISHSPFANIGKKSSEKASRSSFLPTSYRDDDVSYPTFICPRCKTRQREFFTVENAAGQLEGPGSYLALYFSFYVICSLFIFGLEEGWKPLDCIYFAVITLTTAGLGDFVPTSSVNKIICSIFIYFGVACIGLLLGSYIAGMLDDRAKRDRKDKQIESCPNCLRIKTIKEAIVQRNKAIFDAPLVVQNAGSRSERLADHPLNDNSKRTARLAKSFSTSTSAAPRDVGLSDFWNGDTGGNESASPAVSTPSSNSRLLGSPVTRQILGRQKHTRHASIDATNSKLFAGGVPTNYGTAMQSSASDNVLLNSSSAGTEGMGMPKSSSTNRLRTIASSGDLGELDGTASESEYDHDTPSSSSTVSSTEAIWDGTKSQLNAGKYVFLTLRLALLNSMVIIAVGCVGFWLIEGFELVDSWYFTTVLLTTVGYGDITPVTDGGKLFATIYILVAGTLLLNNMSSISMIPLELRRRRIERTVLTQFGDHLDDAALRELATGPLVQRLRLSANRADGLDECTREMFSLAMLVRLGKVTEHDIRGTFSCFRHLDVNNEGVLNSKSIIAGMIAKQRQSNAIRTNSCTSPHPPPPPPPPPPPKDEKEKEMQQFWFGPRGSLHVTTNDSAYLFHNGSDPSIQIGEEELGLPIYGWNDDHLR